VDCLSLTARRPPRCTLFPTRRSSDLEALLEAAAHLAPVELVDPLDRPGGGDLAVDDEPGHAVLDHLAHRPAAPADDRRAAGHGLDRKSTRLNSSHVKISYAVFCLKKK